MSFTPDEIKKIKKEFDNYRLPWITKIVKKFVMPVFRRTILPVFAFMVVLGIIYNSTPYGKYEWMWVVDKSLFFFYFIGTVFISFIGHLAEVISTNKLRNRLGLSQDDFKFFIEKYQVTGID